MSKRTASLIEVDDNNKKVEKAVPTLVKGKGKNQMVMMVRKAPGKSAAQKVQDVLVQHMGVLHSYLYQVWANIKVLKVEHDEIMVKLNEIIQDLTELDV